MIGAGGVTFAIIGYTTDRREETVVPILLLYTEGRRGLGWGVVQW